MFVIVTVTIGAFVKPLMDLKGVLVELHKSIVTLENTLKELTIHNTKEHDEFYDKLEKHDILLTVIETTHNAINHYRPV